MKNIGEYENFSAEDDYVELKNLMNNFLKTIYCVISVIYNKCLLRVNHCFVSNTLPLSVKVFKAFTSVYFIVMYINLL